MVPWQKAIIYTIGILNLIVALDASIIVTSLAAIVNEIGGSTTEAFWVGTSYLLVNAITMPLICAVSEIIGRPICLTFAITIFTIGTIVCCVAGNMGTLLVGRCIQGVGGGGIHSLGLVVQTDIVPLRWRPKWYSIVLGFWALGLCLGPVLGGAIAERTTWRWIFYLMFPICAFGLVAVPYLLTLKPKARTAKEKLSRIDWIGGALFAISGTATLVAISWGGTQYAWDSAVTLVPLIVGVIGLVITITYEHRFAKHPFLEKALFKDVGSLVTYLAAVAQGIVLYSALYYCPFYFMAVKGYTSLQAGVALLPLLFTITVSGMITGRLVTRFNNYRLPIWIGWFIGAVSPGMVMIWRTNDSAAVWVLTYIIGGLGQGAILNAQNFASQAICNPGDEGKAAATYTFSRQVGMSLGVGIGATTFQNVMKLRLDRDGLPTSIATQAEAYIPTLHSLPPGAMRDTLYDAYKFGIQIVFSISVGVSVLTLVMTVLFMKHVDMNRKIDTEHLLDTQRITEHWGNKAKTVEETRATGYFKPLPSC
ncbi:major facilitator superfamily transporter [Periconia macrospinosa]|uniref:Major facilitator superfamily transporter n=1 Tax=Periconia macrospinosa TaxID=97972 RepID=A0A2V1CZK9_9PLEO|nr:major facilitator superfamily transporter [Periconia macrospinosa]